MEAFIRGECRQLARPVQRIEVELRVGIDGGDDEAHQISKELGLPEQDGFIAVAVRVL